MTKLKKKKKSSSFAPESPALTTTPPPSLCTSRQAEEGWGWSGRLPAAPGRYGSRKINCPPTHSPPSTILPACRSKLALFPPSTLCLPLHPLHPPHPTPTSDPSGVYYHRFPSGIAVAVYRLGRVRAAARIRVAKGCWGAKGGWFPCGVLKSRENR